MCVGDDLNLPLQSAHAGAVALQDIATLVDALPVSAAWIGTDLRYRYVNRTYADWFDLTPETMVGRTVAEVIGEQAWALAGPPIQRALAGERVSYETWMPYARGGKRFVNIDLMPRREDDGSINGCHALIQDITARKLSEESLLAERARADEELQLAAMVYQHSSEAMMVCDEEYTIIAINAAFSQLTGFTAAEACGKNPRFLASSHHDDAFHQAVQQSLHSTGRWQGEVWSQRKNGDIFAERITINTIRRPDGRIHRYVALFSDITEKKKSDALIWQQANFDALTGLPNRRMFRDRLEQGMKKSRRDHQKLAMLFIDLDQFKEVNDTLGHHMGDELLVEAARRIRQCVRESDTVARLGGDEFTVALAQLNDTARVDHIAQNIINALAAPYSLSGEQVFVSASIGITVYPDDGEDIEQLFKHADQAMYAAKNAGRNRFCHFTPELQIAAQARMRLTADLRNAIKGDQFRLYFQPIVDLRTGRVHKAEALIRWQHPQRGLISPAEFIPLAEASGMIVDIGKWVFNESARWVKRFRQQHKEFQISVNQSPLEFLREVEAHGSWSARLTALGLPGQAMVAEITEGMLLDASEPVTDRLLQLRDAGIQVALDDFGTGYSSLSYLKKFDIDYLKIDQSFMRNLAAGTSDMALSEAMIVMAHKLGLKVIAEGVETDEQRRLLIEAGCDYAQGYLFSRPVPAVDFEDMLTA